MSEERRVSNELLAEKIRVLERSVRELKEEVRKIDDEVGDLDKVNGLVAHRLLEIESAIKEVKDAVAKDTGWRAFFLDFVKAVVQIATLVLAGKWIF